MDNSPLPSFKQAACCFGGIFLLISLGIFWLGISLHILLFTALAWSCFHGTLLGHTFSQQRKAMGEGIHKGLGAIYIFVIIGLLIAALIESGTVAWLIYFGLKYLSPGYFLPVGLILCTLMSLATGTSWGTVATAGVVLMKIGTAMGIPAPLIAGMVISGASFGDKMSLISDTTNLAAMSSGAPLFRHVRVMSWTSLPAYLIALVGFAIINSLYFSQLDTLTAASQMQRSLAEVFNITPWALLPLAVLIGLSQKKYAPELAMLGSVVAAAVVAVTTQNAQLTDFLNSLHVGYQAETGLASLDDLLSRGGIQSMMWTLSLCMIALALGGVLSALGILTALFQGFIHRVRRTGSLVATTIGTGFLSNMCLGEAYLSIVLGGQFYREAYREKKLDPTMLSRSLEEGATLTTGLIPWTTAGLFYSATLGVEVLEFAPWALFNLINPLLAIAMTSLGIGILYKGSTRTPDVAHSR